MYSSLRRRIIAGDVKSDGRRGGLVSLLKSDSALDVGVTPENCDCGRQDDESVEKMKWMEEVC